ncbi:MAG TPA: hypothetical protein VF841_06875 [Anaeromyxobacter sp.]
MIAGLALALALASAAAPPVDGAPALTATSPAETSLAQTPAAETPPDRTSPVATSPAAAADADAAAPEPEPEPEQTVGSHLGWRHAIGLGPHSTTFFSKEGSQYTFHSGSVGYLVSRGARGAFAQLFLLWPLQARQDGHIYATANYYRRRSGGDLLFGPEWRWTYRGAEAEAGPGVHGTLIYLPGKAGYRDFSALPLGAGIEGSLRWETRASRLSRAVTVGTYASAAYDFYDPMRAEDLAHGFTFRAGVILGLGERR